MVATLLRLKFRLLLNGLKRSTAQLIAMIAGLAAVAVTGLGLLAAGFGASFAASANLGLAGAIVILIGTAVLLGWTIVPPLFFGVDPTLDPQRFATLNVPRRSLAIGLLLSGFVGLPAVLTVCFAAGTSLVWLRQPAAVVPALVGGLLGAFLAIALSRLVAAAMSGALASRRGRDVAGVGAMVIFILLSIGFQFISQSMGAIAENGDLRAQLLAQAKLADYAAWTPFGAPWAIGPAAAAGEWGKAALFLVLTLAYIAAVTWLWSVAMSRAIVRPPSASASKASDENRIATFVARWGARPGWLQVSAVTARCLRYWRSDPRYLAQAVVMPLMPVMMIVIALVSPAPDQMAVAGAPLVAFVLAVSLSNDIGYDSTAFWLHVFAPVRGRTDRAGRAWALSIWGIPIMVLSIVVCVWVGKAGEYWPAVTGVTFAMAYSGIGASLVSSALATTPCPLPGESPMASKSGSGALKMAVAFGVMGACFALSLPTLVFAVLNLVNGAVWGYVTLVVGLVTAVGCTIGGILLGGSLLERRKLALLAQLVKQDA